MKILTLLLIIFFITGCSKDKTLIDSDYSKLLNDYNTNLTEKRILEEEYYNLKDDYDRLVKEKNEMQVQYNSLLNKYGDGDYLYYDHIKLNKIERLLSEINFFYEEITKYSAGKKDLTILNMYNEEIINEGDKIGGLVVSNLSKQNVSDGVNEYSIGFQGEFVVTGKLFFDGHDVAIGLYLSEDEVKKIPHTYFQREKGIRFNFNANSEIFINPLNKKYPNIKSEDDLFNYLQMNNDEIIIKAKFNNLWVNFPIGKYVSNSADLIEVLEIK